MRRDGATRSPVRGGGEEQRFQTVRPLALCVTPCERPVTVSGRIMLCRSGFFHIDKISLWARTVIVPLMVLQALKPKAINRAAHHREMFHQDPKTLGPPAKEPHRNGPGSSFGRVGYVLRAIEPVRPKGIPQTRDR